MRKIYLIIAVAGLLSACGPKTEQFDKPDQVQVEVVSKGIVGQDTLPDWVTIITDQDTGCQYLASNNGGLVKREGSGCPTKGPMVEESPSS